MDAYNETLRGVRWVLDKCTSYQVAKDLEINNRTINRYQNGESPIRNMKAETLGLIYNYYLKERMEMNMESLDKAIKEFNDWNHAARIYIDLEDGMFETQVYSNGVQMAENFSEENFVAVYTKDEYEDVKIADKRKEYIIEYARLILDGTEPTLAEYELADSFPFFR